MRLFESIRHISIAALLLLSCNVVSAAHLLMVEQKDCPYCDRFYAEIGPIYPNTAEGKLAPLLKADLHDPLEDQYELTGPVFATPTFILIENGIEVDRLVGYQGDEFFWFLLGDMLEKLDQ